VAAINGEAKFDTVLTSITNRGIHALWSKTTGSHWPAVSCLVPNRDGWIVGGLWQRENFLPLNESNSGLACDMDSSMG